jgi:hypothetical protein
LLEKEKGLKKSKVVISLENLEKSLNEENIRNDDGIYKGEESIHDSRPLTDISS